MRFADLPEVEESVHIAASPDAIWPLISDISFLVGSSDELQDVSWCDDGAAPAVGRQFVGTNTNEHFGTWQTTATIIECDEPTRFAWAVGDVDAPNTTWRFTLEPANGATILTHWLRIGPGESGLTYVIARMPDKEEAIVARRVRDLAAAMRASLAAVKARAEQA